MRTLNILLAAVMLAGTAFAGPKTSPRKKSPWLYAGEDHGIRFFFQPDKRGGIRIKLENSLHTHVDVLYRVKDTDWNKTFNCSLAAGAVDSTTRYQPMEAQVRYPYFDRIFLERDQRTASTQPAPDELNASQPRLIANSY